MYLSRAVGLRSLVALGLGEVAAQGEDRVEAARGVGRREDGVLVVRIEPRLRPIRLVVDPHAGEDQRIERRLPEDLGAELAGDDDLVRIGRPAAVVALGLDRPGDCAGVLPVPGHGHQVQTVRIDRHLVHRHDLAEPGDAVVGAIGAVAVEVGAVEDDEAVLAAMLLVRRFEDLLADLAGHGVGEDRLHRSTDIAGVVRQRCGRSG